MRIIHTIRTMNREAGGPVIVVEQFASAQRKQGHEVRIVTCDAPNVLSDPEQGSLEIVNLGPSFGTFGYTSRYLKWFREETGNIDVVIVHGLYQFNLVGTWLALRHTQCPYLVYAHGALDPWFRKATAGKELKKSIFRRFVLAPALERAEALIFTAADERLLAHSVINFYRGKEIISPLGIADPFASEIVKSEAFYDKFPILLGKRLWLFLNRIHQKKGLELLLEAFAKVAVAHGDIYLVIAGPCEDKKYYARLQTKVAQMEQSISRRIVWAGMLTGEIKWGAFRAAEIFVLFSHSENFCISIVEALACSVPVISTRRVNIWREIEEDGAGWFGEDSLEESVLSLNKWLNASQATRLAMRNAAKSCFQKRFEITKAAEKLTGLIQECCN